ncbi:MAG: LysR family transcriptional regulator [Muribaculaceae bacterium]|nr:LysR family transcriptional regulator [Muribaculaceae bacterium]
MTLQQLKYVVAVNKYRNFAKAADACSVTQPTLSAMLQKLENELDVRLFDRTSKNVAPTTAGIKVIQLAEKTLASAARIHNVVDERKGSASGELRLSIGPTIAPYILPDFISKYTRQYPNVQLLIKDMKVSSVLNALLDGSIDAGIGIAGNSRKGIKEIPLYTESIEVYTSIKHPEDVGNRFRWVMKEALSLRENAFTYMPDDSKSHIYEATTVEQLIRLVDLEGGTTMIPHMHLRYLTPEQRRNVVTLRPEQVSQRKISLYVRTNYDREFMLASITGVLKQVIPASMIDENF